MTNEASGSARENPMEGLDDLSDFKTRSAPKASPPAEVINEIAASAGFPSRPVSAIEAPTAVLPAILAPAPTEAEKTPPAPAPQATEALPAPPWTGAVGKGPTTNMTPDGELAGKMKWLAQNMPGGISMRQLVLDATEKYVNELIEKHYKP